MRLRSLAPLALVAMTLLGSACKDVTAPDPSVQISMPPFERQIVQVSPNVCQGCVYYNRVKFFAPIGVAPVVDLSVMNVSASSPEVAIVGNPRMTPDPDNVCNSSCTVIAWEIYINFTVAKTGEADVTMALHADPQKKSTFRVISVNQERCEPGVTCKG